MPTDRAGFSAASPHPTNETLLVVMNVNAFFVVPARLGFVKRLNLLLLLVRYDIGCCCVFNFVGNIELHKLSKQKALEGKFSTKC